MLWLIWIPLVLLAPAVLLSGCADGHQPAPQTQGEPGDDPGDGYRDDQSDPDAPKTVTSKQIVSFDCWCSTLDDAEPGAVGNHIYRLRAKLENGAVKGTYEVRDAEEERSFRESHSFLSQIYELVERYDVAQYNGHRVEVHGLPGDYGVDLHIQFASGESISAYDNQDCILPYNFINELLRLFERGVAKPPVVLPLSAATQMEREVYPGGSGEMCRPVYLLDEAGYDPLSAALAALNEQWRDGAAGEMDYFRSAARGALFYRAEPFVTRSDSQVVSFYERITRYESADWESALTSVQTHNLDAATGRELRDASDGG